MHRSAIVNALGADFRLIGPDHVMVKSTKPVIAVCAVRTGAGKSQTTRKIQTMLREAGKKVVSIRHPMPYGDLVKQRVQRFATVEDLARHECTIEEMEEYEPHIVAGNVIYAGRRLRGDPARGREGGRRHPLGRRQQRLQLLQGRPVHHRRRSASSRRRSPLLPRRGQSAARRRRRAQQDRHGRPRRHRS